MSVTVYAVGRIVVNYSDVQFVFARRAGNLVMLRGPQNHPLQSLAFTEAAAAVANANPKDLEGGESNV
jgi:hypothetical protein